MFNVAEGSRTSRLKLGTIEAVDTDAADAAGVSYAIKTDTWASSAAAACPFELVASKCAGAATEATALKVNKPHLLTPVNTINSPY